jgi:hypothetical protein
MIVRQFLHWVRTAPAGERAEATGALARAFLSDLSAEDRAAAEGAMITLIDDPRLYNIPNPHVDGMLIGHVVKDNIVWVTDLWNPAPNSGKSENAEAFAAALKKIGITGATLAGGHGANGKQSDLEAVMAAK